MHFGDPGRYFRWAHATRFAKTYFELWSQLPVNQKMSQLLWESTNHGRSLKQAVPEQEGSFFALWFGRLLAVANQKGTVNVCEEHWWRRRACTITSVFLWISTASALLASLRAQQANKTRLFISFFKATATKPLSEFLALAWVERTLSMVGE